MATHSSVTSVPLRTMPLLALLVDQVNSLPVYLALAAPNLIVSLVPQVHHLLLPRVHAFVAQVLLKTERDLISIAIFALQTHILQLVARMATPLFLMSMVFLEGKIHK